MDYLIEMKICINNKNENRMKRIFFIVCLICFTVSLVKAQDLKIANIFSDDMVLQQKTETPFWGWGQPNRQITIKVSWLQDTVFLDKVTSTGDWKILIPTPEFGGPHKVSITDGLETIELKDVFVGEVWLASGQSNMYMPLSGYCCQPVEESTEAILGASKKQVHFINIPNLAAYKPQKDIQAKWVKATVENVAECSAVGWFFADFLQQNLGVPVGIINASFGGSGVEAWMNVEACKQFDDIQVPEPKNETSTVINNVPTVLYNGMIRPIIGYGIKGVIWYQGESNVFNVPRYAPSVAAMVQGWRKDWGRGEFPFYYVQIAPYEYKEWNFFKPQWPEISAYQREAQLRCLSLIPNSGMAVLLDVGEQYIIHPRKKRVVGERLGLLALANTYGVKGFEAESPSFHKMEVEGDKAVLHFEHAHNGLTSYGKPLTLFEIAGENRVFHKAEAYIDLEKGTVIVSCKYVDNPKAVRYAFRNYVEAELFGSGGLPVSSFRTDNWE